MSIYHYVQSEPGLWTVGYGKPGVDWEPESDHGTVREAAARAAWLNGGPEPESESADSDLRTSVAALVQQLGELTAVLRSMAEHMAQQRDGAS